MHTNSYYSKLMKPQEHNIMNKLGTNDQTTLGTNNQTILRTNVKKKLEPVNSSYYVDQNKHLNENVFVRKKHYENLKMTVRPKKVELLEDLNLIHG